jgi:hypothetical protein
MVDLKQIPTRVLLAMAISMYFKIMVKKIKNKFRGRKTSHGKTYSSI